MLAWIAVSAGCADVETHAQLQEMHPHVLMKTSLGDVLVELDREHAPVSVDNFLHYVRDHQYDGTIFHRVIPGFVVQGGGFDADNKERPTRPAIRLEADNGVSNARGTLAMAREAAPDSATDEFYFNLVNNRKLDPPAGVSGSVAGYAVFGHIIDGLDVVDRIAAVPTGASGPFARDAPLTPVVLLRVERLPPGQ